MNSGVVAIYFRKSPFLVFFSFEVSLYFLGGDGLIDDLVRGVFGD